MKTTSEMTSKDGAEIKVVKEVCPKDNVDSSVHVEITHNGQNVGFDVDPFEFSLCLMSSCSGMMPMFLGMNHKEDERTV